MSRQLDVGDTVAYTSPWGERPRRYEGTVTGVGDDGLITAQFPQDGAAPMRVTALPDAFVYVRATRLPDGEPGHHPDDRPGHRIHSADGRVLSPGYMPDPDAKRKAAEFPGYIDWTCLVVPDPDYTPDAGEPS